MSAQSTSTPPPREMPHEGLQSSFFLRRQLRAYMMASLPSQPLQPQRQHETLSPPSQSHRLQTHISLTYPPSNRTSSSLLAPLDRARSPEIPPTPSSEAAAATPTNPSPTSTPAARPFLPPLQSQTSSTDLAALSVTVPSRAWASWLSRACAGGCYETEHYCEGCGEMVARTADGEARLVVAVGLRGVGVCAEGGGDEVCGGRSGEGEGRGGREIKELKRRTEVLVREVRVARRVEVDGLQGAWVEVGDVRRVPLVELDGGREVAVEAMGHSGPRHGGIGSAEMR
ncbi:hypothetical protein LTS18_003530 [Coniosporium uncinatum]|uniref:Uncharacterized protein n=1 Tax=Coniosporium uncinatum TaxID=93489 RepID=A0ACC3DTC6_9PEZI|nr:hypothetical protein LTS18_003530 [Coniosporium uncinatum]